jgi:hypothetical protein
MGIGAGMRIRRIQLVGLAALAGVGATGEAGATDRTISTATTTPVTTSQPEPPGNVTPGNITVASGGSITVTTGQTAITVDSNNSVTNSGTLGSTDANNTTGILIQGGNVGTPPTISNAGTISLLETYARSDSNSDGDLDGVFAQGTGRNGIWLAAGPTFTGNVSNSGQITIEGTASAGIRLDGLLTGTLTHTGSINVLGDNSVGIAINGGISGDALLRGNVSVIGQNSVGLLVADPISGALRLNGAWAATGFGSTTRPANVTNLDADDLLIGGAAVAIRDSVAGGVTVEGIGVEDDVDDDGDGTTEAAGDTDDDRSASISSFGSAPALLVEADPLATLTLGVNSAGFGLQTRGGVFANAVYDGVNAVALRIAGNGAGSFVNVNGGIALDSTVIAAAADGSATAVFLGSGVSAPALLVRNSVTSSVVTDAVRQSSAVVFGAGASVPTFFNSGRVIAVVQGENGSATSITDLSNSLTSITNTGSIEAIITATDSDFTDDIPPPPITGSTTAIDVSASTVAVTLTQATLTDPLVNPAFADINDDDTVDDNAASVPAIRIIGDVLFGSGGDTFNLLAGSMTGDLSFGAGADSFVINNGATFTGELNDGDANLALNVINGTLALNGGSTTISSANFGGGAGTALWRVQLGTNTLAPPVLAATGTVTFGTNADIIPLLPSGLPTTAAITFLTAAGGFGGTEGNVTGAVIGGAYLYDVSISLASPTAMQASYTLRTPTQLGLTSNEAAAFANILDALRTDADASSALSGLTTQADFENAYEDLMPSYASGAAELAATAIQQAQSAATNRLAATRLHDLDEVSVWAQEIGYGLTRTPASSNGQAFDGQGFGLAVGIDGPLENGAMFGLSASFITSEVEEDGRPDGQISTWFAQGNAYLGTAMGPIDLDFVGGLGFGRLQSERSVQIGAFEADTDAEWWAYEAHAAARASLPLSLGEHFVISPQAALTYVGLGEQGYEEEGSATVAYEADDAFSQRLWADVGVELSARWGGRGSTMFAPRIYAGYRANALSESGERTYRYLAGGSSFTLEDEEYGDGGPLVGVGIDASNGYSTFSLSYEGELGDQIERHSLNAAVRFRF